MKIKITADSTCDLPRSLCAEYNVELMPLSVVLGEQAYLDGIEIESSGLFEYMSRDEKHTCHTAACNVAQYQQVFAKYKDYDAVIHISISQKLSCSHDNALQAAAGFTNVHVIDSQNICGGSAILVESAALMAAKQAPAEDIIRRLQEEKEKLNSTFIINSLDYLKRGGRCSALSQLGANLLQMKLCLELNKGNIEAGKKHRGTFAKCLQKYIADTLSQPNAINSRVLYFATAALPAEVTEEARTQIEALGIFERIEHIEAGCVISCHCGPVACGLFFLNN